MTRRIQIGDNFNFLTVVAKAPCIGKHRRHYWKCECVCGNTKNIRASHIISGHIKSCGCKMKELVSLSNKRHGYSHSKTYVAWEGMKQRCLTPAHKAYKHYGGRGISICKRWMKFENFLADMGEVPEGKTLERKNNNKGYTPDNCVWATHLEQGRNRRNNKIIKYLGERLPLSIWTEKLGLNYYTVHYRFQHGWSAERAFEFKKPKTLSGG